MSQCVNQGMIFGLDKYMYVNIPSSTNYEWTVKFLLGFNIVQSALLWKNNDVI